MDELVFLGTMVLILAVVIWLAKVIRNKKTGRKSSHPIYQHNTRKRTPHQHKSHAMMHSHSSSERLHATDDIWRNSRVKVTESNWQSSVIVANKILSDTELALEKREPAHGHGMSTIDYKPDETSKRKSKSVGGRHPNR